MRNGDAGSTAAALSIRRKGTLKFLAEKDEE